MEDTCKKLYKTPSVCPLELELEALLCLSDFIMEPPFEGEGEDW